VARRRRRLGSGGGRRGGGGADARTPRSQTIFTSTPRADQRTSVESRCSHYRARPGVRQNGGAESPQIIRRIVGGSILKRHKAESAAGLRTLRVAASPFCRRRRRRTASQIRRRTARPSFCAAERRCTSFHNHGNAVWLPWPIRRRSPPGRAQTPWYRRPARTAAGDHRIAA
jgi:hypothetical protein